MRRTTITIALVTGVAGLLVSPAMAAKPKPFKKSFTATDTTPDPTASAPKEAGGKYDGCDGMIAPFAEKGFTDKLPAKGTLRVLLNNTGDWGLDVRDAKGRVLASSDGDTPEDKEAVTTKIKAAGTYTIVACNLGGSPQATGTYEYKPA
jgi:hypothetical protein